MTGYTTPTINGPTSQDFEAGFRQSWDNAQAQAATLAAGYRALGYAQGVRGDWQQRMGEQTQGLPANVVARARQALDAEASARATLTRIRTEAQAWINQYRPADGLASSALRDAWTVAKKAFDDAEEATRPALLALGEVIALDAETRAVINAYPSTRAQIEAQAQTLMAQLEASTAAAQRRRAAAGLG